jgi:hypothetical protein
MKKQPNLDRLKAALSEHAAKSAQQAERARTADDGDDRAPFVAYEWPYLQLADRLEDRIRKGEFGEDGKLPGTEELAEWYGVKVGVIRHARQELMRRNLVVFKLGHGYFARVATGKHRG